jgi:hypothetical protein
MADVGTTVELLIDQSEDYVVQFIITDDYGNPVVLSGDGAFRITDVAQTTIPAAVTSLMLPGNYVFDLLAHVVDNSGTRALKLVSGTVTVTTTFTTLGDLTATGAASTSLIT